MVAIICVNREDPERPNCRYAKDFKCMIGMKVNYNQKMFYCEHYEPQETVLRRLTPVFISKCGEWLLLRLSWQMERETLFYKMLDNLRFVALCVVIFLLPSKRHTPSITTIIQGKFPVISFYATGFYFLATGWAIQRLNRKKGWKTYEVTAEGERLNLPSKFKHVTLRNILCRTSKRTQNQGTESRR